MSRQKNILLEEPNLKETPELEPFTVIGLERKKRETGSQALVKQSPSISKEKRGEKVRVGVRIKNGKVFNDLTSKQLSSKTFYN